MIAKRLLALVAAAAGSTVSCHREAALRGGAVEAQLLAATVAHDLGNVTRLLGLRADPNKMVPDKEGHLESPWRWVLRQWRSDRRDLEPIARAMLKAGANPELAWGESKLKFSSAYGIRQTVPLLEAVTNDAPGIVRALLDVRLDRANGPLCLELAVENGQAEIVHMLVEAGVDVNTTRGPTTPLVAAIARRDVALMTYLEQHGARENP